MAVKARVLLKGGAVGGRAEAAGRPALTHDELDQRKRAILGVTLALVAAKGADQVRLRDVALAAGVSVGALQHYFDSRDQLIREAFDQHAREVVTSIAQSDDPSAEPWARLRGALEAVVRPDFAQRSALWIEFAAASLHDSQLCALMDSAYEAWREFLTDIVRSGTEAGAFAPALPPASVVTCLLALIDGLELSVAIEVHGATPASVLKELTDTARVLAGRRD